MIKSEKSPSISLQNQNKIDREMCLRFKDFRKQQGLTQPEFAEILNTTRVAVNAIENCRYNPGITILKRWRQRYKISYDWIMDGK